MLAGALLAAGCSRQAGSPPKPPPPPLEYLGEWGIKGSGPGQLDDPVALAADASGNVYIADRGSGFVHKFDAEGKPLLSFQDERLKQPAAITVDAGGAIYLADQRRRSILIYYPDGTRYREIRAGAMFTPLSVAVNGEGEIFVNDLKTGRMEKLTPEGRRVKSWDIGDPDFLGLAVLACGPDGALYVAELLNDRLRKFTRDGESVAAWPLTSPADAEKNSLKHFRAGLAVSEKYAFVEDLTERRMGVWTLDGKLKLSDDLGGRLRSESNPFRGFAVSPRGELLVLEGSRPGVMRFRINF